MELICGVDEAGRGPLAGPVVAAAVILDVPIEGLNDSKKISEKKRLKLFDEIQDKAKAFSIALATAEEIDEINVLQATFLAMRRAVSNLSITPSEVWVDGNQLTDFKIPAKAFVGGDGLHDPISAASILAKVTRDQIMCEYAEKYPGYGFEKHKGYGTQVHMSQLKILGPCPIHRQSFAPVQKSFKEKVC